MSIATTTLERSGPPPRFVLDLAGPEYVWRQVAQHLAERIATGEFQRRLPNREIIASEYGVSVHSVRRAVRYLADQGVVTAVNARGTYLDV
ncbi:GntR family transcriptional regulator [Saccharomonospora iraqiensis]|uniref:GntR family transcriptional regulator n=1 Tax=Saccharomonospora iraqiensis TaxID=52698 RepID=UPI00022E5372|nr:GntR family transcriptional regulator [Saccharomonospora iraqiensis]